jgi:DNA helicase-2/ATP-dependent DNA helicase PcrA
VVKNNRRRKDKTLWTDQAGGEPLRLTLVGDEEEEGQLIVEGLTRAVHRQGRSLKDVAILYRTNAQSRAIENALRRAAVPYELVGGVPFYQRREVKDLLAYLRLAVNPVDDLAVRRVLNVPKRGIGKTTLDRVAALGFPEGVGLLDAARRGGAGHQPRARRCSVRGSSTTRGSGRMMERSRRSTTGVSRGDDPERRPDRIDNVHELVVGAPVRGPSPSVTYEVALLTDSARRRRRRCAWWPPTIRGWSSTSSPTGLGETDPHASSSMDEAGLEEASPLLRGADRGRFT